MEQKTSDEKILEQLNSLIGGKNLVAKQDNKNTKKVKKVVESKTENQPNFVKPIVVKGKDKSPKVKITFLGGVGEIGKNMTAIEYGDEMIVVDCGMSFPDDDLPGIDVVTPDITYLVQNKHQILAILHQE